MARRHTLRIPKPKDTGGVGGFFRNWMTIIRSSKEKYKFECSNCFFAQEKYTAISAINILAHKYL